MYSVTVNKSTIHQVETSSGKISVDGAEMSIDLQEVKAGQFHILHNNRSFTVQVVSVDKDTKTAEVRVNNREYTLEVKDQFDLLLHQLGMDDLNTKKVNDIKAPMPGLVLKVLVKDGDEIQKGDSLVVLEAMKMENIIKAPAAGTIKAIKVLPADKVEKNQVLITLA